MTRTIEKYDVVVIGGGAGGLSAAVGAARTGSRTLLVERYGFMGGAATNAQVLAYCGFFLSGPKAIPSVAGIGREVLGELEALGLDVSPIVSKSGYWVIMLDPEAVKLAFDRVALGAGVELRLHTRLFSAAVEADRIVSVDLLDHSGMTTVEASAFVDASGEATLSAAAGAALSQQGGPGAHLQPASLPIRIGGVAPDAKFDRALMTEIIRDYNANADRPILREDGGVLVRLPMTGAYWWTAIDLATDGITGGSLTDAETAAREQAWANLEVLRRHPGFEKAHIVATGPQVGIRETRRPFSRRDVIGGDVLAGHRSDDAIARASWPMEVHEAPGRARFVDVGGEGFFDVPSGAVEARDIVNLRLAGRVVGSDADAYGSVRVMGTAFATGHAAGISAALAAGDERTDIGRLRRLLLEQGAIL
ncbi:MAG: FAD-dependent oxidoreductase [Rhizobiaceae bacterium]